jgi:hypothetical protein
MRHVAFARDDRIRRLVDPVTFEREETGTELGFVGTIREDRSSPGTPRQGTWIGG